MAGLAESHSTPFVAMVADCYRDAVVAGADMVRATQALESVRQAAGSAEDIARACDAVVGALVENTDKPLDVCLQSLREHLHEELYESAIRRVEGAFGTDVEQGWRVWQLTWLHAVWRWPEPVWQRYTQSEFAFPRATDIARFRTVTSAILDERWGDSYDLFTELSEASWLPDDERAIILDTLSMIELYIFARPDESKALLERADVADRQSPRVLAGWGEWWLAQADKLVEAEAAAALDRAREYADRSAAADPRMSRAVLLRAQLAAHEASDPAASAEYYEQAMALGEYAGWRHLVGAELERADGNPHAVPVEAMIELALRVWPHREADTYRAIANALDLRKVPTAADVFYERALAADPGRANIHTERGYERADANDGETARAMFARAIELAPGSFDGWYGMAWLCDHNEQWDLALENYLQALDRRPLAERLLVGRIAVCLRELGRVEEARQRLAGALRSQPDDASILSELEDLARVSYQDSADPEFALAIYDEARSIVGAGYEPVYRNNRGHVSYWNADYLVAAAEYEQATVADPQNAVYPSNAGLAYEKALAAGDVSVLPRAISVLRKAFELAPTSTEYQVRLDALERQATLAARYGDDVLTRLPVTLPIRVEITPDFYPYMLEAESTQLTERFNAKVEAMRERIRGDMGVLIPGIRFSPFDIATVDGNARCSVHGTAMALADLPIATRFADCEPAAIGELSPDTDADVDVATDPVTGAAGTLIPDDVLLGGVGCRDPRMGGRGLPRPMGRVDRAAQSRRVRRSRCRRRRDRCRGGRAWSDRRGGCRGVSR